VVLVDFERELAMEECLLADPLVLSPQSRRAGDPDMRAQANLAGVLDLDQC
jgi:hypothetical protein